MTCFAWQPYLCVRLALFFLHFRGMRYSASTRYPRRSVLIMLYGCIPYPHADRFLDGRSWTRLSEHLAAPPTVPAGGTFRKGANRAVTVLGRELSARRNLEIVKIFPG